jgi:hypothetical protein
MPAISVTDTYDAVLTTTLREYIPKLHDNVFNKIPFFAWLTAQGRMKMVDGGYEIIVPVMYEGNDTVGWYTGYDELDVTPQDGMTVARYGWKQLAVSISISRKEERQNSGKHKLISLLDSKVQQAEGTLRREFSRRLFAGFGDSTYTTASGDSAEEVTSLLTFMPKAAASTGVRTTGDYGTVGYINGEAGYNTWWRCQQGPLSNYDDLATIYAAFDTVYNDCYKGSETGYPDLILAPQAQYQAYAISMSTYERFTDQRMADMGFQNLRFRGAVMMWDPHHAGLLASDDLSTFFINSDHLYLVVDTQTNFITTPFYRPTNQDARTCQILWMGNLVCNNRRGLGLVQAVG